jgi:putative redox protein
MHIYDNSDVRAAQRLPLEHVSVDVTHDKMHAQDSDPATNVRIDNFRRAMRLSGPLTPKQTTRLMEIADKCPVHKTLEQSSRIETVFASGA